MYRFGGCRVAGLRAASRRKGYLVSQRACLSTAGHFKIPKPFNEPNRDFSPGSPERESIQTALQQLKTRLPVNVPQVIGGVESFPNGGKVFETRMPSLQSQEFARAAQTSSKDVSRAIEDALSAKQKWAATPLSDRASVFLRAAELVSGKYRDQLLSSTMLGQGKNAWQAEIDAAAELADFYRFNVSFAQKIYENQPDLIAKGEHGRIDWRPLEGFVYAVSPFNFTAIGGNLVSAPAIMGNVVLWKPSPYSVYSSYLVHKILLEAGLPPNVIQFIPGDAKEITDTVFNHPQFAALHFTGSSDVFRNLHLKAAEGIASKRYRELPRLVGETSGKNFHLVHKSADIPNAVKHTIRAAFEYAGQKCSACSRVYVPQSQSASFLEQLRDELDKVSMGPPEKWQSFLGPVIHKESFAKIKSAIDSANSDKRLEKVYGGTYDDSEGLYIQPSVYATKETDHELFDKELFGPLLIVHIYPDAEFDQTLDTIDKHGGGLSLTGAIFASDREAIGLAEERLRFAAGNFYTNCKTTGAVIGQQQFGGGRASGTNDKAGSVGLVQRFASPRTLKEDYKTLGSVLYPSNQE